jgi:hypothetical protein
MDGDAPRIRPLGDEREHYWLALSMSQTVGLDLQAEIAAGRFSQEEWAETVTRCRGCDWAGGCPGWMAEHGEAEAAPPRCVNAARFNALLGLDEPDHGVPPDGRTGAGNGG